MKNNIKKINLIIISIIFLLCPVLAFAQNPSTDSAGNEITSDSIFVKLQVPLPFIATDCKVVDSDGKEVKDDNGNSIPAVCSLSDYIAGMYRLLIGVGALFAVVMIIIAGYQWMFAGGSSDKTGAAKKRLLGAVIGLMLALLSYIILNAITPRLVSLRMPKVEPVQGIFSSLDDTYCNSPTLLASAMNEKYNPDNPEDKTRILDKARFSLSFFDSQLHKRDESNELLFPGTQCGVSYDIARSNNPNFNTIGQCDGYNCFDENKDITSEICASKRCQEVYLYGNINWETFSNAYIDKIDVLFVCNDTNYLGFDDETTTVDSRELSHATAYVFVPKLSLDYQTYSRGREKRVDYFNTFKTLHCRNRGGFKGFVLKIEINDDTSLGPTIDDNFAMGKSNPNQQNKCGGLPFHGIDNNTGQNDYDFDAIDWSEVSASELFQPDDFIDGTRCNFDIDRNMFPAS